MTKVEELPQVEAQPKERVFHYRQEFEFFLDAVGRAANFQGASGEGIRRIKEVLRQEFGHGLVEPPA